MIDINLCISGFTQNEAKRHGMFKLKEKLFLCPKWNISSRPTNLKSNRILLRTWRNNWDQLAEHLWLIAEYYKHTLNINVYAYSWGAGWGAMQFAKQMSKRGILINNMVLSDAVFRHPNFFCRWTSLLPRRAVKIMVPRNVMSVYSFYQTNNKPQGHRIVASGFTELHSPVKLDYTHQYMDDAREFHNLCLKIAQGETETRRK